MNPEEIISRFIAENGPVSFRDFVWLLLYHPEVGYYVRCEYEDNYEKCLRRVALEAAVEDMLEKCGGDIIELRTLNDVEGLEDGFTGVVVANEFFTSLPFHLVDGGKEVYVDSELTEILRDPSEDLRSFLEYAAPYIEVTRFPACVDAAKIVERIGEAIEKGFLIAIDYGLPVEEYYSRKLRIACFSEDSFGHNPYSHVGQQAVAAPIDFTALMEWGSRSGLCLTGFTSYRYFLLNTIGEDEMEEPSSFKSIAMPVTLKVLVMHKGMRWQKLKCLQSVPSFGYWNRYNYEITNDYESGD
ncbi:SAM-dependent methyltransferase [Archaeoglobus veneficus]|uniref:Uncharacterized protein n=1 Tax=Archaeoglobus veneficus (strain DSM 11195 / SNP6) TaxID=693661 RepID=F2KQ25_ARCVS|nr:SAM-dependent methyltransferase [Archaeoglobus veneficus]AEA47628.1 protein of unknown function DUF185 [Archaeoglobus veneficus SNP6]